MLSIIDQTSNISLLLTKGWTMFQVPGSQWGINFIWGEINGIRGEPEEPPPVAE